MFSTTRWDRGANDHGDRSIGALPMLCVPLLGFGIVFMLLYLHRTGFCAVIARRFIVEIWQFAFLGEVH